MRVVSLTCSNTEIVWALGCGGDLVGVDNHSDFPADVVVRLPRVGPDLGIDVKRVAALDPDLVLASLTVPGHERIVEALARAKLPFIALEPVCVADVYDDVRRVAALLGVAERGERVIREMRAELDAPDESDSVRPAVLVEWWPKPVIVPGRLSWVNQLLIAAGGRNPMEDEAVKSRPITDGEARVWDPDAIVISWCGVPPARYRLDVVYRRPGWQGLRALERRHVYAVPEAYLGRPGPRLVDGCRAIRRIVRALEG